jgi:hypothetical protein
VRCAIAGMVERNAGLPPEKRIAFRVVVHLGEVVEESDIWLNRPDSRLIRSPAPASKNARTDPARRLGTRAGEVVKLRGKRQ